MAKKIEINYWTVSKRFLIIFSLLTVIGSAGTYCINYFAPATVVAAQGKILEAQAVAMQMVNRRIGLNVSQDNIDRQEYDLEWTVQQVTTPRKKDPPTDAEQQIIKKKEIKLQEIKAIHNGRVKKFEDDFGEKAQL